MSQNPKLPSPGASVSAEATLASVFHAAAHRHASLPAFVSRDARGDFTETSYSDLLEQALALATSLIELGVKRGDTIGLLADNRIEWMVADWAALFCGAADVPRGSDITDAETRHILSHSDAVLVLAENRALVERVVRNRDSYPNIRYIVAMDAATASPPGNPHFATLVARGRSLRQAGDRSVEERMRSVKPEDVATIIYTSGTTGVPKGVVLTHSNLVSQIRNIPIRLGTQDSLLSILPIWHAYERVVEYASLHMGAKTTYTNVRHVGEDLKRVRPTFMASAPRLWESLHQRVLNGVRAAPAPRRWLFHSAVACSRTFRRAVAFLRGNALDLEGHTGARTVLEGGAHAVLLAASAIPFVILDALVLRKVRAALGGRLRGTISGGGALPLHIDEFLNYAGMPVLEGYGLTETSPVLAVRLAERVVIGTVGPAYPETELRIVALGTGEVLYPDPSRSDLGRGLRGEIQARGPQVMRGYHKLPAVTASVMKDGWFSTGDIGIMTFNDCLKIVGRCKETIVLISGENVEPGPIEARLTESPLVLQAVVTGQDAHHLSALIVPNLEGFKAAGVVCENLAQLTAHPRFRAMIDAEIRARVSRERGFKAFELIQSWRPLTKPFEVGDELTATYKLKRHVIAEKYPES